MSEAIATGEESAVVETVVEPVKVQDIKNNGADTLAQLEEWKGHSRTWEGRAKTLQSDLALTKSEYEATKTNFDKADADLRLAQTEARDAKLELAKYRVSAKHGLPEKALGLLRGENEEEIEASAAVLLEILELKKTPTRRPITTQGAKTENASDDPYDAIKQWQSARL